MPAIQQTNLLRKLSSHIKPILLIDFPALNRANIFLDCLQKKLPIKKGTPIFHLLLMVDFFISNFIKKADIFNEYFANQCTINVNDSGLPNLVPNTDASLSHISL